MKCAFLALVVYLSILRIKSELTNADRKAFLKEQNALRSQVAKGKVFNNATGANLPKASNMRQLVWSKTLEAQALKYISACIFYPGGGLTLYAASGNVDTATLLKNATTAWSDKFAKYGTQADLTFNTTFYLASDLDYETPYDPYYGIAFNQAIWAKSSKVGCSSAVCDNNTISALVCLYRSAGIIDTDLIYKKGKPGKKCPKGTKKVKKTGLCQAKSKKAKKPIQK